jgi:hypothetical protein
VRQFAIAAMMIVLLPASAYAQRSVTARTESEQKRDAAVDREYQDTLKRMKAREQATKTDPWQTVRPPTADNTTKR